MITQLTDNKLLNQLGPLLVEDPQSPAYARSLTIVARTLKFWENELNTNLFFGGDHLSLGDIVAGTTLPLFIKLGIDFSPYPHLTAWIHRLQDRPTWQQTDLSAEAWREFKRRIRILLLMQDKRQIQP
jgi:glutathione S-transferase